MYNISLGHGGTERGVEVRIEAFGIMACLYAIKRVRAHDTISQMRELAYTHTHTPFARVAAHVT